MSAWYQRPLAGVLLDISGVLFESGAKTPIAGSVEAVQRLRQSGLPVRFCTNETQKTRGKLCEKLTGMGFQVKEEEIFPPVPAVCSVLKQQNLRPHLVVHPACLPDFKGIDTSNPNCVVLGDAAEEFSYENLNKAFQLLMSLEKPILISLGKSKYYQEDGRPCLDVGSYAKALEYACDIEAEVVGKPASAFFNAVLQDMKVSPDQALMIGDDIVSDVGGAQACGMMGVQVRTGKFRPEDENHPTVKPNGYVDNLLQAVDFICKNRP